MAKEEKDLQQTWTDSRAKIFLGVSAYTVAIIAIVATGAYYLDQYLGTFPKIFIAGLILGFPLTQFLIYKKFKKFANKELKK